MSEASSLPGWYPDPGHLHELRYFDGTSWTDHVADSGRANQAPLGPTPPGVLAWHSPSIMIRSATASSPVAEVPRAKMWILAALSASVFWLNSPGTRIVVPIGLLFAIWCWRTTSE